MEISDALWDALELMSREMSVDRDSLVNQALFTFARFNGYVTPGSVAPHANTAAPQPSASAVPPVALPLASPPNAVRRAAEPAPPVAATSTVPPEVGDARLATNSVSAVPPADPTPPDVRPADSAPAPEPLGATPSTDPDAFAPTAASAAVPAATNAREAAQTAPASTGADDAEPADDEELDDGIDALPENGEVEWKVPRFILADKAIATVKGTVKGRDFQGAVQLLDQRGAVLRTLDLGGPVEDSRVESVLANETRDAKAWTQLAQQLAKEHHVGEATLAMLRAAGAGEPIESVRSWLERHTLVRRERAALERAQKATFVLSNMNRFGAPPPRKASYLVEEVLQGAFPASICRELAIDQDQYASSRAAADLIRAAKLLNPDDKAFYAYTQALIEMSLGHPDASRVCADELRESSEEQATFLTTYLNGLFPKFEFWPGDDALSSIELQVEEQAPARKLADYRNAIQKTALRLKTLREHLLALVPPDTSWLPPSTDALLAKSKVTLGDDEGLGLEEWQERSIPQLLRFTRNEWARLSWLCWLAGLDAVALPSATSKPRSPTVVARALRLRLALFELKAEDTTLEDGIDEADLDDARLVSAIAWCDTTPAEIDGANAAELAIPETAAVITAFDWAASAEIASPFAAADAADEDEDDADEDEAAGDEGVDDEGDEAAGGEEPAAATEAASDRAPPAEEPAAAERPAEPRPEPAAGDDDVPAEPAERTAIVRPSGRKIWVQRQSGEVVELAGLRFTVGRDPRCEIVIASPRVSREHAAILVDEETVLVTDLNSSNGTFFNGERIMKHVVSDGDVVQFGNENVTFLLSDPNA
ncbi:MAG: FHA domain-containing protein [Myxococcaceae bacterium]|nr:FHA domain-containing protein [Myxococcaceae bacterium]